MKKKKNYKLGDLRGGVVRWSGQWSGQVCTRRTFWGKRLENECKPFLHTLQTIGFTNMRRVQT
jgi:hypothetical protein